MLFNEEHPECNQQLRLLFEHLLLLPVRQTLKVHLWNNQKNYCMLIFSKSFTKPEELIDDKADLLRDLRETISILQKKLCPVCWGRNQIAIFRIKKKDIIINASCRDKERARKRTTFGLLRFVKIKIYNLD